MSNGVESSGPAEDGGDTREKRLPRRWLIGGVGIGGIGLATAAGAVGSRAVGAGSGSSTESSSALGCVRAEVVTNYGADPTGSEDSTAAWQNAIDAAVDGGGVVWAPAGSYMISGEIIVHGHVSIRGVYPSNDGRNGAGGGTRIICAGNTGKYAMRIEPPNIESKPDSKIWGVSLTDLKFDGFVNGRRSGRGGIILRRVWSEISLERLSFAGLLREGIFFEQSQDGALTGISMIDVGTAGMYPALRMEKNTNALHVFGAHIESCAFAVKLGDASRHNQFVASKFEMYTYGPKASPIQISNAWENAFIGCQFVQRNADDEYFYDGTDAPHMINCDGPDSTTIFGSCMFTTQEYHLRPQDENQGGRWIRSAIGVTKIHHSVLNTCWGGSGEPSILLGFNCSFVDNSVYSRSKNGERNLMALGGGNIVDSNQIIANDPDALVDKGIIFACTGDKNTFGSSNRIVGTVASYYSGSGAQTVIEGERLAHEVPDGTVVPDVGWKTPGASRLCRCSYTTPTDITGLRGAFNNDVVTIIFGTNNQTIKSSDRLRLRGGLDVVPPSGSVMTFYFSGENWTEWSRNF